MPFQQSGTFRFMPENFQGLENDIGMADIKTFWYHSKVLDIRMAT